MPYSDHIDNTIRMVVDNAGSVWHYYSGTFWTVSTWNGKKVLLCAPALLNGNIDIDRGEVNAGDVEECEQHHLDFVNSVFGTAFELRGATADNPIGYPTHG